MDIRLSSLNFGTLVRSLADLLMPRVCAVCGRQLLACEEHLCLSCEADLPLTHFENLYHNPMADKFGAQVDAPAYVRATALFYYREGYKNITRELKYRRNFPLGKHFAAMLGGRMTVADGLGADVVVPVPLHWTRHFVRGYNQAGLIGMELARRLGASFVPRLLKRIRRTRTQTRLSAGERSANVDGAFSVRRRAVERLLEGRGLRGIGGSCSSSGGSTGCGPLRILLVDDVFTTGSTLAECYRALHAAFGSAAVISVAALAYVDGD